MRSTLSNFIYSMNLLCDAIEIVHPSSPTWSHYSFCSLDDDGVIGTERYALVIAMTELYYSLMILMSASTYFILLSIPVCGLIDQLGAVRAHIKLHGNLIDFSCSPYPLKHCIRHHRTYCENKLHRETGKCGANVMLTSLIEAHKDDVPDYEELMVHLARQRHEQCAYFESRRMTDSKKNFFDKVARYQRVLRFNLHDNHLEYGDLWHTEQQESDSD